MNEKKYRKWCDDLERRYDVMPRWYWDHSRRRAEFEKENKSDRK